jgi:hypothetical protein
MKFVVLALLSLVTVSTIKINVPPQDEEQFFFDEDNDELTETGAEINAVSYPANVLDLTYWKFQTPDAKSSGGVVEIL